MLNTKAAIPAVKANKPAQWIAAVLLVVILLSQAGLSPSLASPNILAFSVAINSDPATLDAPDASNEAGIQVVSQLYDTLVRYEPGGSRPLPGLAQSWTNSSDGLTWTFTLRSGVTFHDGTSLDGAAVLYNFQRWWDPTHPQHDAAFESFNYLLGIKNDSNGPNLIASLSSTNATTFIITLKSPAPILAFVAYPTFGIASPTAIQAGTIDTLPVGSGPFKFNSRVSGSSIFLTRYDGYWGTKAVASGLTFYVLPTSAGQLSALQSNSVQSAGDISGADLTTAAADPNLQVYWKPSLTMGYLGLNRSKTPLDNLLVRQAIAHAINKQALMALYNPGTQVATQFLPPSIWGFDASISDYSYDPTLAKALLTQAGHPSGITISLAYRTVSRPYMPDPDALANAIKADLAAANITANLDRYTDSGLFITKVYAGDFETFLLGWGADYLHPDDFFSPHFCAQYLPFGPKDTQLCAKLAEALTVQTDALRMDAYKWVSQRVHDTLPAIPLADVRDPLVTRRTISGVLPSFYFESYQPAFPPSRWTYLPTILK